MIRFIHAADLHLDTPFSGLEQLSKPLAEKLRMAPYTSFEKIVNQAIQKEVDFVVISGDLYNTKRVNIKAQSLFIDQLNRLEEANIAVFLIRGNHDFLTEEDKTLTLPLPKNVYTFSADVSTHIFETKNKARVAVSGFSYETQWVFERKVNDYPPRRNDVDLHIGLLHGSLDGADANYAPFTIQELEAKKYDYWALGHIHQRQGLSSNIYYSGNIQGLHKNETGEKGCLLVEWSAQTLTTKFIATAPIIWESLTVNISDVKNIAELFVLLRDEMKTLEEKYEVLIHLTLTSKQDDQEQLIEVIQEPGFNELLSQQLKLPRLWIASVEFLLEDISEAQTLQRLYPELWEQAKEKAQQKETFEELTAGIFNQIPSKYLNQTNELAYRKKMLEKALIKIQLK